MSRNSVTAEISRADLLLLATLVTALTCAAAWLYPIWDDARFAILSQQFGSEAIRSGAGSRVLVGEAWVFLFRHHLEFGVGIVLHWIAWLATGITTMHLWNYIFRGRARFALLPALVAVAPILCKVQLIAIDVVLICLIGPLLALIAILILLRTSLLQPLRVGWTALALALVTVSILISDYALATALAGVVIFVAQALKGYRRRASAIVATLIAVCSATAFFVFSVLARTAASPEFTAGFALHSLPRKIRIMPFRLLSALWQGALGGLFERLASVTVNDKTALLSFLCGIVFSALVALVVFQKSEQHSATREDAFWFVTLLAATLVGVFPIFLMGRSFVDKWDTRFWLPVLPIVSVLSVYILLYIVRRPIWLLVPLCCGFLAGYSTTAEIADKYQHPEPAFAPAQTPAINQATVSKDARSVPLPP